MRYLLLLALAAPLVACAPSPAAAPSAVAPAPAGPAGAASVERTRLVHALPTRDFGYLPVFTALGKGFFAEEGLEMEYPVMTSSAAIPALMNKEIQIGPSTVRASYQGAPARVLFYEFNKVTFLAVASPDVATYRDLAGKVVAVSSPGGSEDLALKLLLKREGVPLSDVQVVTTGPSHQRIQAMLAGQIQFSLLNPDLALDMERKGFRILGHVRDLMPVPFGPFSVHEDTLRAQPPWLKPWLRASIRGVQTVKKNPAEAAEIAIRDLGLDPEIAPRAVELIALAMDEDDPGGFTEAGLILGTQLDMEVLNLTGDPAELVQKAYDLTLLRQVQREIGIFCTTGYQCR
jgi:NitT/TauT family transport system substrate-binding protein